MEFNKIVKKLEFSQIETQEIICMKNLRPGFIAR